MGNLATRIPEDPVEEARRLLAAAEGAGLLLRAMGGVAIALHTDIAFSHPFRRDYGDLDFACSRKSRNQLADFFATQGYEPNLRLNGYIGQVRQMYMDLQNDRHVDIFIGQLQMCHRIPLEDRLSVEECTVPLAELLLSKLQVVELNRKDVLDICALLAEHLVTDDDGEAVNGARVAALCSADWGLWRTLQLNFQRLRELVPSLGLATEAQQSVCAALDRLETFIEQRPKSFRWEARNLIGDRIRWYDLPEEPGNG